MMLLSQFKEIKEVEAFYTESDGKWREKNFYISHLEYGYINKEFISKISAPKSIDGEIQTKCSAYNDLPMPAPVSDGTAMRERTEIEEREMDKNVSKNGADFGQLGNMAAMREALEKMSDLFDRGVICTSCANTAEEMEQIEELYLMAQAALAMEANNMKTMRDALVAVKKSIDGIGASSLDCDPEILMASLTQVCARLSARIDAALAAPPRNCDRFADELDAQLAFLNEVWLISINRETMTEQDTYENWTDEMRTRYGRWLLAPATEQKKEAEIGRPRRICDDKNIV